MGQTTTHILQIIIKILDKATKPLNDLNERIKKADASFKALNNVLLSLGLAFLFTGMMLKRFFDNFLKSVWTTWRQVIDVHDEFFQKTQQLTAAWEFFKFSLMDALGQSPLFLALIDAVISLINWLGQLSPQAKETIMIFIIGAAIASTAMMLVGAALLFLLGPLALIKYVTTGAFSKIVWVLGIVILTTLALLGIWSSDKFTNFEKILLSIAVAALGVGLSLVAAGALGAAGWAFIIAAIGLTIFAIYRFRYEIWAGIQKIVAMHEFLGTMMVSLFAVAIASTIIAWDKFLAHIKLWDLQAELIVKKFANSFLDSIEGAINKGIALFNSFLDKIRSITISVSLPGIAGFEGFSKTFQPFSGIGTLGEVSIPRIETKSLEGAIDTQKTLIDQLNKAGNFSDLMEIAWNDAMSELEDRFVKIDKELADNKAKREEQAKEENKALWEGVAASIISQTHDMGERIAQGLENNPLLKALNTTMEKNADVTEDGLKSQETVLKDQKDILQQIADNTEAGKTWFGSGQAGA